MNEFERVMTSRFHPNDNAITVDDYDNALHIIKQKLYDGDYFTSTDSSINIAYDRTIHRYVCSLVRILVESQIALNKLNTNLSEEDYVTEQESELKRKLIDSIVYFQSLRNNGKECAYFEYNNGNSKIATTCINTLKEKYEKDLNREPISIDEVQRLLLGEDIPIELNSKFLHLCH